MKLTDLKWPDVEALSRDTPVSQITANVLKRFTT